MLNKLKAHLRDARAGEEITVNVTRGDIARAIDERNQGVPPQYCCPYYQAIIRRDGIMAANFHRHFARVWFQRSGGKVTVLRYCYTNGKDMNGRDLVCAFDVYGTATPGKVTLYPPRGVRTLAYLRNKQKVHGKNRKDVKGKSTAKVAKLKQQGKHKPRGYKAGSLTVTDGVASDGKGRWGLGQHLTIA